LVRRGLSVLDILWASTAAVASIITKNTGYITALIFPIAVLFGLLRGKYRKLAWVLLGVGFLAAFIVAFRWNSPVYWYHTTNQEGEVSRSSRKAVWGKRYFVLNAGKPTSLTGYLLCTKLSRQKTCGSCREKRSPLVHGCGLTSP